MIEQPRTLGKKGGGDFPGGPKGPWQPHHAPWLPYLQLRAALGAPTSPQTSVLTSLQLAGLCALPAAALGRLRQFWVGN